MNKIILTIAAVGFSAATALAEVKVDAPAPTFNELDGMGKAHQLSDYKGQWVVLEWYNKDCPYVKKHYGSQNMQKLQAEYTKKGVAWLTVNSSAKGKQGYLDGAGTIENAKSAGAASTAVLIDADGTMGKAYAAKTTPHMFVINPEGKVVYAGAIDSDDSSDPKTIAKATNYVRAALDAGMSGKMVATKTSKPYGCSVKYN